MNKMSDKIISIAKVELGTKESNNGDDKYIKWYGGLPLTSKWCAIFVSWVFFILNKNAYFPEFCDCDAGLAWFTEHKQFELSKAQKGSYVPQLGDVIFFSDKGTMKDSTHVGLVTKADKINVYTIEGNSKDMVREKSYAINSTYIIGYGIPDYPDYIPEKTITPSSDAEDIKWAQDKLNTVLPDIPGITPLKVDGDYGPVTRIATLIYWNSLGWNKAMADDGTRIGLKTISRLSSLTK